jgi:hypothetical protein
MRLHTVMAVVVLAVVPFGHSDARAADSYGAPTVVIEPGDITPLRGPNIRNPLGPSSVYAPLPPLPQPRARALERALESELDRLPSRTAARPDGGLPELRLQQDRARARAALEAFKTLRPDAPSIPLLERRLDRVERPTRLGQ